MPGSPEGAGWKVRKPGEGEENREGKEKSGKDFT